MLLDLDLTSAGKPSDGTVRREPGMRSVSNHAAAGSGRGASKRRCLRGVMCVVTKIVRDGQTCWVYAPLLPGVPRRDRPP